jgi:hypothetical protein
MPVVQTDFSIVRPEFQNVLAVKLSCLQHYLLMLLKLKKPELDGICEHRFVGIADRYCFIINNNCFG